MIRKTSKVLIVEDNRAIRNMLSHNVRLMLNLDVETAGSIAEASELLDHYPEQFFVAILDLNLPDGPDGEVVDVIIERGIPPIILTANICDDLHDEMMNKPIIDYVIKRNLNECEYIIETIRRLYDNRQRKILVVDDSRSSRQLMRALLERHYYQVYEAADGHQALEVIKENEDILLSIVDFNMPGMNGIDLCSAIRENYSRHEMAIVGISTAGTGLISVKLLKAGANDFITRPFLHEEFFCRVNQNIDNIAQYYQLRDFSDRDALTGLYNRHYVFNTGEKLLQNANRINFDLVTAIIDIDGLKAINDEHGHAIGDMAIKHIANILKESIRDSDIISRIGSDEFCLVCVNSGRNNTANTLQRTLQLIDDSPLKVEGKSIHITVSIGYSDMLRESLYEMVKDAYTALHQSKDERDDLIVPYRKDA